MLRVSLYTNRPSDIAMYYSQWIAIYCTLRCVTPVVCVTNEREESVVNQHN